MIKRFDLSRYNSVFYISITSMSSRPSRIKLNPVISRVFGIIDLVQIPQKYLLNKTQRRLSSVMTFLAL